MDWKKLFKYANGELISLLTNEVVGFLDRKGYVVLSIKSKTHKVHRIIYEMHFGEIPKGMQVDHIDGNKSNNLVNNLRLATNQQNNFNKAKYRNNTSGFKGVYYEKKNGKWRAQTNYSGVKKHLGYFDTAEEASIMYNIEAKKREGEYYKDK